MTEANTVKTTFGELTVLETIIGEHTDIRILENRYSEYFVMYQYSRTNNTFRFAMDRSDRSAYTTTSLNAAKSKAKRLHKDCNPR